MAKSKLALPDETGSAHHKDDFLLVGIGASAGGIQALREFFSELPDNSGMAYVVIVHLSQEHESNLHSILQNHTAMPVIQVQKMVKVQPNHVYVIPPAKHLEMLDGHLSLKEPERILGKRVPIDRFFRSLSESYGRRAVCIILSGSGMDGTLGLKHVKGRNGFAIVQDPNDAEHDSMPRNAIATGIVDVVLPVREIPQKLLSVYATTKRFNLVESDDGKVEQEIKGVEALRELLLYLNTRTGHDFTNYKRPTLLRRIARHLQIHEVDNIPAYLDILRKRPEEAHSLIKNLLINVTNFFRDEEAFKVLEKEVIPRLFEGKNQTHMLRVWSVGCASGEEAYSLAILLAEYADRLPNPPKIQIFASDVDEEAITEARDGRYTESIIADISPERLHRFFIHEGNTFRVKKEIREMILFARHNVLRDPPFSRLDLVVCRNVLIYLNRDTQEKVLRIFHFASLPTGFLFLGSSETAEGISSLFTFIDKKHRIYQRRESDKAVLPQMPIAGKWQARTPEIAIYAPGIPKAQSFSEVHLRLLEPFMPPSVLLNEEYEIVHLSENVGRYLRFVGGDITSNLLKVVHPTLRGDLRAALFTARQSNKEEMTRPIKVRLNDGESMINMLVQPVHAPDAMRGYSMVMFHESPVEPPPPGELPSQLLVEDIAMETVVRKLEDELQRTQDQLQKTSEQYETSVEELKASNEELQAINEELRSATEELETSKEELQSINEELSTVNHELKDKIDEVSRSNSDLQNLMASTDIGTVFLDRSLNVKRFTPQMQTLFHLIPSDVGRPLDHLKHSFKYDNFSKDATQVLRNLLPIEREVKDKNDRIYLLRFFPYRTQDDKIDGVVLTFLDVTERRLVEKARLFLGSIVESSQDAILTVDFEGNITSWNKAAEELYGYSAKEAFGKPLTMLTLPQDVKQVLTNAEKVRQHHVVEMYDSIRINKDGRQMNLELVLSPVKDEEGKAIGISTIARDVTVRREVEEERRESQERLQRLIESASDYAIFTLDGERRVNYWNSGAERIFGYTEAEILGQSGDILYTPEDQARLVPEHEMKTALSKGRAEDERWHIRKNGSRFYASGVVTVMQDNGQTGFVKIARDMTKHKAAEEKLRESEERFRALVNQAIAGIFRVDLNNVLQFVNQTFCAMLGFEESELLGKTPWEFTHPGDMEENRQKFLRLVEQGEPFHDEKRLFRKDGSIVWTNVSASAIYDAEGKPQSVVAVVLDITERRQAEEALREADRHKDEFLAMLSHELRNPLTPIRGALDLMQRNGDAAMVKRSHEIIGRQLAHMEHLVNDLLEISRIQLGKINLESKPVVLHDAIALALEIIGQQLAANQQTLEVQLPEEPLVVNGDFDRLSQIFQNLLANASKFTRSGGNIQLTAEVQNDEALIRVRDNGIGIPEAELANIFEMFKQLERKGKRLQNGLGIGLALAKNLVEIQGGSIEAQSEGLGKGSEFTVRLPLLPVAEEPTSAGIKTLPTLDSENPAKKKKCRVLVVDDNLDAAEMMQEFILLEGHEVQTANSGYSAIELAQKLKPNAAVLDIGLPDMDGYDLARRLRKDFPKIHLIAYSGWGQESDRQKSREAGFDYHVVKPKGVEEILRLLGAK